VNYYYGWMDGWRWHGRRLSCSIGCSSDEFRAAVEATSSSPLVGWLDHHVRASYSSDNDMLLIEHTAEFSQGFEKVSRFLWTRRSMPTSTSTVPSISSSPSSSKGIDIGTVIWSTLAADEPESRRMTSLDAELFWLRSSFTVPRETCHRLSDGIKRLLVIDNGTRAPDWEDRIVSPTNQFVGLVHLSTRVVTIYDMAVLADPDSNATVRPLRAITLEGESKETTDATIDWCGHDHLIEHAGTLLHIYDVHSGRLLRSISNIARTTSLKTFEDGVGYFLVVGEVMKGGKPKYVIEAWSIPYALDSKNVRGYYQWDIDSNHGTDAEWISPYLIAITTSMPKDDDEMKRDPTNDGADDVDLEDKKLRSCVTLHSLAPMPGSLLSSPSTTSLTVMPPSTATSSSSEGMNSNSTCVKMLSLSWAVSFTRSITVPLALVSSLCEHMLLSLHSYDIPIDLIAIMIGYSLD
jgi:hypothetical protein